MEWNRSETIGLASASCVFCRGLGLRKTPVKGESRVCGCVLRAIFRSCFIRYRHCQEKAGVTSAITYDHSAGPRGHRVYGRRNEEFIADFELVCRRSLNELEYKVLKMHFMEGADWKQCTERLSLDKGEFFHEVYKVQEKLGRVFRELRPYALFPLDEYFSGIKNNNKVEVMEAPEEAEEESEVIETGRANVIEMPRRDNGNYEKFPVRERKLA